MATADPTSLQFAGFTLDLAARTLVDAGGRDVALRRSEFELLLAFVAAPGRALSRDQLLEAVAGRRSEPFDRSVDVLVGRLRRKIEPEPSEPRLIVTVPGVGYRFAVRPQPAGAESGAAPAAPLAAQPTSPERRQLTVMQCGLSGPALLSARGDPEDLQQLLVAFHTRCAAIIHEAGGTIAKRLGVTVLAYFGYPQAHEDEAERAIRAALRLVETTGAIETGHPGALQARVGIATGLVLVGDLLGAGSAELAVLGEAPNLAAGLLASAAPGTVLIGPPTRRLVGDTFRYREHAPTPIGGFADPVPAWEVIGEGLESRFEALHGHAVTELVGREEELFFLLRRWAQARVGVGRVVLVTGEPGIGKSRLVRAVQDQLGSEAPLQLRYFCSPHHRDSALHPVIAQLERVAGFSRDDTGETRFAKLKALLARSNASDEATALIASLLSVSAGESYRLPEMSPQKHREKTLTALLELFAGLVARGPTLVIFEDMHWVDPTTLELLARTVEQVASIRVLLLMTARSEFRLPWPDQAHVTTLLLNRLSDDEASMLVQRVAGETPLPGTALRQIVRHAEGVPLFVEELTKTVLETGAPAEGQRSASLPVPTGLQDSLEARLDRLGSAREVAQIGAVIGREFTHQLLSAVACQPDFALEQALTRLVRSELLLRGGTPIDARYTFKHALVQHAAYQSLPRSRRAALHVRAVDALVGLDPNAETTQPDLLAHHCEQGGLVEQAARLYTRAGFGSARRGAYTEAYEQFANASRMIAAMPEGGSRDRRELEVVLCFITATRWHRGYASSEAAAAHSRAAELWERLGQPAEFLEVPRTRYEFHLFRGETQQAQEIALHLLGASKQRADPRFHIMGHLLAASAAMIRGEPLLNVEAHLQEVLALIQSCSNAPSVPWKPLSELEAIHASSIWAMTHHLFSRVRCWLGYLDQAHTHLSPIVERTTPTGYAVVEVAFWVTEVGVSSFFTEPEQLTRSVDRLSKLAREFGLTLYEAWARVYQGYVISCCEDPEKGIALMNEGRKAYSDIEVVTWSGYHRALLSEAYQRLGRLHDARQLLLEVQDSAERTGERWYDAELLRRLGELDHQEGDAGAAEKRFKQALAISRRQHAKLWELHAATSLARLWHEQQRTAEARAVLAPVYGWFKEGLQTSSLRRAKALLDELDPAGW